MASALEFMGIVALIMLGIIGLGFVAAFVMAQVRYRRYMKVFNEDCGKGRFEKLPS